MPSASSPAVPPRVPAFEPLLRQIAEAIVKDGRRGGLALVQRAIRDADRRVADEATLIPWMTRMAIDASELGAMMAYLYLRERELSEGR